MAATLGRLVVFCVMPCLQRYSPPIISIPRQLAPKLRRKVVEVLRNYVKISVLRGVCLAF